MKKKNYILYLTLYQRFRRQKKVFFWKKNESNGKIESKFSIKTAKRRNFWCKKGGKKGKKGQ